ncbi:hypothetical protein CC86DRAFT_468617 [Ophiobolus disseminans]|uniref:Fungal N-terminal domain-containing protein n=1 Tax=Ophiobolus disseminans TaxID=1469910 RepID=A0A6A6ZTX2_9PLEO|nr:hypothetical protein CC86DRAFT_468617 [Ophiobolus disseminans]
MALETAAAVIGIIAAAGKVAETLGPVVSAFKDVTKNISAVLFEVDTSRLILFALLKYVDGLSIISYNRGELIQVEQLAVTITGGVLLFSELEALVIESVGSDLGLRTRIQWAWNDEKFASLVSRMQNFKSSASLILNILQCDSDAEARRDREELRALTSLVLQSNLDLSRRIAYMQDCFTSSDSVYTYQTDNQSQAALRNINYEDASTLSQQTNNTLQYVQDTTSLLLQFEKDLLESRVYRTARAHTSDVSFRSSVGISHAWTALCDISLSNITNTSVVALPIYWKDLSNHQHYQFPPTLSSHWSMPAPEEPTALHRMSEMSSTVSRPDSAISFDARESSQNTARSSRTSTTSTDLCESVDRERDEEPCELLSHYAARKNVFERRHNVQCQPRNDSMYVFDSEIANFYIRDFLLCSQKLEKTRHSDTFVLLYNTTSERSFYRMCQYYEAVLSNQATGHAPILIAAIRTQLDHAENMVEKGMVFAKQKGCDFCVLHKDDAETLAAAFYDLVGAYWIYRDTGVEEWAWHAQNDNEAMPFATLAPAQSLERIRLSAKISALMVDRGDDSLPPKKRRLEVIDELY